MTAKLALKNDAYKNFVQGQILRPYQSDIFDDDKSIAFTMRIYDRLPNFIEDYPEWVEKVFNRMAKIFESVDASLFPEGEPKQAILQKMREKGIIIT